MLFLGHSKGFIFYFSFAQFEIDGFWVISSKFDLRIQSINSIDCACVSFLTPTEIYVNNNEPFNISLKLLTETGSPPSYPILIAMALNLYTYDDALKVAPKIAGLGSSPTTISDSNGVANFTNCNVIKLKHNW